MAVQIELDQNIRDWVLLPIVVIMILVTLLRTNVQVLLADDKLVSLKETRYKATVGRSARLRALGSLVSASSFSRRMEYLTGKDGLLNEKVPGGQAAMASGMMSNPMAMLKGNLVFMIQNVVMIGVINTFFEGFLLVKIPFHLTNRFKGMTQKGIGLAALDASYVSSLSWYFIVMFGIRGFLSLFMSEEGAMDEAKMMEMQMSMGTSGGPGMGYDADAAYKQERDALGLLPYNDAVLRAAEAQLAAEGRRLRQRASSS